MRINRAIFHVVVLALPFVLIILPFTKSTATSPQDANTAETYNAQGVTLFNAGKFQEAVNAFKQAIKLKPDYSDGHYHLGSTYFQLGEYKKAVDAFKQAIRYQPDFALAYNNLGTTYYKLGERKKAIEAYNEAIRLDPKAKGTHYNLGAIYAERGNEQPALAEYKVLQTLDSKLAQDLYILIYKPMACVVSNGAVQLNVIATDAQGAPVSELISEDFQVFEDGAPQAISSFSKSETPTVYGVAVDTSGSIRPAFALMIDACKEIIEKTLPADETLLVRFVSSDKIENVQEFTSDKQLLSKSIDTLYIEGGQSAVLDAVYVSAQHVAGYRFADTSVHRVLILLTDGEDRASYYNTEQLMKLLRRIDLQIFAISLSINERGSGKLNQDQPKRSVDLLKTLASETGGEAFFPKSAAKLKTTIDRIFDLIRAEYTISYKPTKPIELGIYRPVTISILQKPGRENWNVITRDGYIFSPR